MKIAQSWRGPWTGGVLHAFEQDYARSQRTVCGLNTESPSWEITTGQPSSVTCRRCRRSMVLPNASDPSRRLT